MTSHAFNTWIQGNCIYATAPYVSFTTLTHLFFFFSLSQRAPLDSLETPALLESQVLL